MKNKISFNGSVKTFWIFCFQIIDEHESMVHITIRHVNTIIIVIHACSLLRTLLLLWCIGKSILLGMGINIIEAIISTNGRLTLDLKMLFSQEINTTWQENYGSNNLHQWELTYELEKLLFAKDNLYYHIDNVFIWLRNYVPFLKYSLYGIFISLSTLKFMMSTWVLTYMISYLPHWYLLTDRQ